MKLTLQAMSPTRKVWVLVADEALARLLEWPGPGQELRQVEQLTGAADLYRETAGFAGQVAQHLAEARRAGRFDRLRIVAAPRFLDPLRKALDAEVAALVSDALDKDLIHVDARELTLRLFPPTAQDG